MARGCHKLIRQGAILVERPTEILDSLSPVATELADALRGRLSDCEPAPLQRGTRRLNARHRPIWDALGHDSVNMDQLAERTALTTPELSSMLLIMEIEGTITVSDGRYTRNT